jgi:hypothetical protein
VQLRLTRQALRDLNLSIEKYSRKSASEYEGEHDMIATFVSMRSQSPIGQETTKLPVTKATVWNIHHGRFRGLTWHDVNSDVVWLLGVGWHETGSLDDAYVELKDWDSSGHLMPTIADYRDLELTEEDTLEFVTEVSVQAPKLVGEARQQLGSEVQAVLAGRIKTSVLVYDISEDEETEFLEEIFVSFEMPPIEGPCVMPSHPEWIHVVLAAMLPDGELSRFAYGVTFPRIGGSRSNEIVVRYS